MADPNAEYFHPASLDEWHTWLAEHHASSSGVWFVFWRKESGNVPLDYEQVVIEALCWGWIDGHTRVIDDARRGQWFTRRGPNSAWAATNKARVEQILATGRMQSAGQAVVDAAKANGTWSLLDDAEALVEHPDLTAALDADPVARGHWDAFPPSTRKIALSKIAFAKRPETKARRIADIVDQAARNVRPTP